MSRTTLARRIRRIGILPTTVKEIKEERLEKKDGCESVVTTIKRVPVRHFQKMSNEERAVRAAELKALAKIDRAARRKGGR